MLSTIPQKKAEASKTDLSFPQCKKTFRTLLAISIIAAVSLVHSAVLPMIPTGIMPWEKNAIASTSSSISDLKIRMTDATTAAVSWSNPSLVSCRLIWYPYFEGGQRYGYDALSSRTLYGLNPNTYYKVEIRVAGQTMLTQEFRTPQAGQYSDYRFKLKSATVYTVDDPFKGPDKQKHKSIDKLTVRQMDEIIMMGYNCFFQVDYTINKTSGTKHIADTAALILQSPSGQIYTKYGDKEITQNGSWNTAYYYWDFCSLLEECASADDMTSGRYTVSMYWDGNLVGSTGFNLR